MSNPLRTVLPAEQSSTGRSSSSSTPPNTHLIQKRSRSTNACTECRSAKRRCDGQRPTCFECQKRGIISCRYTDRHHENATAARIVDLLRTVSLEQARRSLDIIRGKPDSSTALHEMTQGQHPAFAVPSNNTPSQYSLPTLQDELLRDFPMAYPPLRSLDTSEIKHSNLMRCKDDTEGSEPHDRQIDNSQPTQTGNRDREYLDPTNIDTDAHIWDYRSSSDPVSGPTQEPTAGHWSLDHLNISWWTSVGVPDDLAARMISLYLHTDHPLLGVFDASTFVADLIQGHGRFCSSLLVNAVLYLACQMYTALDKGAVRYLDDIRSECENLQRSGPQHADHLHVASMVLLSVSLIGHGKDHEVIQYADKASTLSEKAGYCQPRATPNQDNGQKEDDESRACSCAAWGAFNWSVIVSLFYRQPETSIVTYIPTYPMPTPDRTSEKTACVFPALCQLWLLVRDGSWIYYDDGSAAPSNDRRLHLAEHKFREIIAWTNKLPSVLFRSPESSSQTAVFHIWLHAALLDIIRPFTPLFSSDGHPSWNTFSAQQCCTVYAYNASVAQLKRLLVDYRTNYEASTYSILWHTGLLYLTNAMLESPQDPDWYLFTAVCIHGYVSLRRPYRISESIGTALLAMALRKTDMEPQDARHMAEELKAAGVSKPIEDRIRATFLGDLELAVREPDDARVETLAWSFDELALFKEFVVQDPMGN